MYPDSMEHLTQQKVLLRLVGAVERVPTNTYLHSLVYVAQALELIEETYAFDFAYGLPYSLGLEEDLNYYLEEGLIYDTGSGGSLILTARGSDEAETLETRDKLKLIMDGDPRVLSRIVYLLHKEHLDFEAVPERVLNYFLVAPAKTAAALEVYASLKT